MLLFGIKTNTHYVCAGSDVSRQDGNRGNGGAYRGRRLRCAPAQIFTSLGVAGFYYYLGANIQSGVLGKGGRVAMTEMKRKPGPGIPQEQRKIERRL